jgi:prepilin-type N-terminal cleavage/methylation domain-containing protein
MGRMAWKAAKVTAPILRTGNKAGARWWNDGFTLVEIVLVLLVMCLVAAITFPSMARGRTAFHLRAVGRDVIGAMRLARETAVTEQKVMVVEVDSQNQRITVSDEVGGGARSMSMPGDVKIGEVTRVKGGDAVTPAKANQDPLLIRFLPNGSAENALLVLVADTGASLKIATDSITGSARVVPDQGVRVP